MKKLTILLSVLFVALTSVFAQDPVLQLKPRGEVAFAEQSFFTGEDIAFKDTVKAVLTAENLDKAKLAVKKADAESIFKAEISGDEVWVSYVLGAQAVDLKDTIVLYSTEDGIDLTDSLFVSLKVEEKKLPAVLQLKPRGDLPFADQSFFTGEDIALKDTVKAVLTAENLDKAKLALKKADTESIFKAEISGDEVWVSYVLQAQAVDLKDTIVLYSEEEGIDLTDSLFVSLKVEEKARPVITVAELVQFPDADLDTVKVGITKSVSVEFNGEGEVTVSQVYGANEGAFSAKIEEGKLVVIFKDEEAAAGDYVAFVALKAKDAKAVEVKLAANVIKVDPVIELAEEAFAFEAKSYIKGENKEFTGSHEVAFSKNYKIVDEVVPSVKGGAESIFKAALNDAKDKVVISYALAAAAGEYKDTIVLAANGASDEIAVSLNVTELLPSITVTPAKWEKSYIYNDEPFELTGKFTVAVTNELEGVLPTGKIVDDAKGVFSVDDLGKVQLVSFSANAAGEYTAKLVVSYKNAEDAVAELKVVLKENTPPTIAVTGVTLDKTAAELKVDETLQLNATVLPTNATNQNVTWASSAPAVAAVSATGLITAKAEGSATITVTTEDGGKTATCAITVKKDEVPPTPTDEFKLVKNASALKAGLEFIIVASTASKDVAAGALSKTFLEPEEVTISNEAIKLDAGSNVTIFTLGGTAGNWTFANAQGQLLGSNAAKTVGWGIGITTWSISIADGDATISCGNVGDLQYNASSPRFTTYTSNQTLPQIYARTAAPVVPVAVTGVTLDKTSAEIEVGKTLTLTATVAPENATNKNVTWASSDEKIATVANGVVTAKAEGSVTITVKTEDGDKTATCAITVKPSTTPVVDVTGVTLDKTSAEIEVGKTLTLTATVAPENATNKNVTWASSDEKIATVADGVVTAVAEGTATITVKTEDGGKTATCAITVTKAAEAPSLTLVVDPTTLKAGDKLLISDIKHQKAMSVEQVANAKSYYRGVTEFDGQNIPADAEIVELVASGDNFKLKVTGGFLYFDDAWMTAGTGGKKANWLGTNETGSDFNFEKTGDTIYVVEVKNDGIILYNTSSPRFTHYARTTSVRKDGCIALWKVEGEIVPPTPWEPDTISVAEAIAVVAEKKTHYVKGIVTEILSTPEQQEQYGNCDFWLADMEDASAQIKCFRLNWKSADGKFTGNELTVGDTVLVFGQTDIYKQGDNVTNEIVKGYVVDILGEGSGEVPPTPGELLDVDYGYGLYLVDELGAFWEFVAGKLPADPEAEEFEYPVVVFQFENEDQTHLAGKFAIFYGAIYFSDNDSIEVEEGTVEITCVEEGTAESSPYYHFVVTLVDEQGEEYVYEFEIEVDAYDGETFEPIELEDKASQGIENTAVFEIDFNAPFYNIQGMKVGRGTSGILIQNGHKFIIAQ